MIALVLFALMIVSWFVLPGGATTVVAEPTPEWSAEPLMQAAEA